MIPPSPCALPKAITPNSMIKATTSNALTHVALTSSRIFVPAVSRTGIPSANKPLEQNNETKSRQMIVLNAFLLIFLLKKQKCEFSVKDGLSLISLGEIPPLA